MFSFDEWIVERLNVELTGASAAGVRVERIVSVDFYLQTLGDPQNHLEALQAILLSDTQELFRLLLIFQSNICLQALALVFQLS